MTKIVLEAAGRRREFQLGGGTLSVGSGEEARLRLRTPELAEVHFDLQVTEGRVSVRPRPGVVAPKLAGLPRAEPFDLEPGQVLSVGKLKFWIESDLEEEAAAPVRSSTGAPRRRRGGAARRTVSTQRGLPTGALLAIVAVLLGLGYVVVNRIVAKEAAAGPPVAATLTAVRDHLLHGKLDLAETKLDSIEVSDATTAQNEELRTLRADLAARRRERALDSDNLRGNTWFENHLEHYEKRWLSGDPPVARVRLFLERCAEFRRRWPQHSELDWVERQERRFRGHVDLSRPGTWEDLEWALFFWVEQPTRNYAEAFERLDAFIARADGEGLVAATEKRTALLAEREAYHKEKMEEARREYEENDNGSQAVWWLLHGVIWMGDEEMADQAARTLARIPDAVNHLLGYRSQHPDRLEQALKHPRLADLAEELAGL